MNSESSFRMTRSGGDASMCKLCDRGSLQNHYFASRRDFLKGTAAIGATTAGLSLFAARPAAADDDDAPEATGRPGRRYVIRGGSVMSMDPKVGDFVEADVLVEGKKILAVGRNLGAGDAGVIDARGRIVMPGFIDTHHHQFETALRSFLADGVLINDQSGTPSGSTTYYEYVLLKFATVYRPQDVYINELFGGLSQLDDGVTTVHDVSQIHHTPQHSDAAVQALFDTGRRAAFGYFEGAGEGVTVNTPGYAYPQDAFPIEVKMRPGMPPILKMQSLGMEPSLRVDVEVTLTADFFPQMRSMMNQQRMLVNQMTLDQGFPPNPVDWGLPPSAAANPWPKPPAGLPAPLTTRDVLRYATVNGAKALGLADKVGSLTPGKEADIIILDATRINVAPLNQVPGAVVSLMDRTNVETVIVAGKVRKWKGRMLRRGLSAPHPPPVGSPHLIVNPA